LIFIFTAALCVATLQTTMAPTPDSWTTKAQLPPLPNNLLVGCAAVLNGSIYIVTYNNAFYVYNPNSDVWTQRGTVPVPENGELGLCGVSACDNKLYVIGQAGTQTGQVFYVNEAYDPANDTWETKTPLNSLTGDWQTEVVNGKIYIIGGSEGVIGTIQLLQSNNVYDPASDSWSQAAPIPTPVSDYASAVLNNKIYIIGGYDACEYGGITSASYTCVNLVQIFDPSTNQWTQGTSMPSSIMAMGGSATSGTYAPQRIYIVGGYDNYNFLNYNQIYDPETGNWSYGAPLPTATRYLSLENVNDKLYALSGQNSAYVYLTNNEEYTPANWSVPMLTTTIQAATSNGTTIALSMYGNVTASQMSNVTLIANRSSATTSLSFNITGETSTIGFDNITIPKSAVSYGTTPTIYIDGQQAQAQGYTQDHSSYCVWFTTEFSTHQVNITFITMPTPSPSPTLTPSPSPTPTPSPSAPEFPTGMLPSIFLVTAFASGAMICIKKRKK
jgi:N-acetylneuraminic acid mutarotase